MNLKRFNSKMMNWYAVSIRTFWTFPITFPRLKTHLHFRYYENVAD